MQGKTSLIHGDHPHACGDKLVCAGKFFKFIGSSPRVWGQEFKLGFSVSPAGIIPTRVGTSAEIVSSAMRSWDHPHACGDKKNMI